MRRFGKGSLIALVFLLLVGAASARSIAYRSGGAPAARNAMSASHLLPRATRHASRVSPFSISRALFGSALPMLHGTGFAAAPLAATGCGANGTIADLSGFEDADGNLAIDKAGCMDWNGFAP